MDSLIDAVHLGHDRPLHCLPRLAHRRDGLAHRRDSGHRCADGGLRGGAGDLETVRGICEDGARGQERMGMICEVSLKTLIYPRLSSRCLEGPRIVALDR